MINSQMLRKFVRDQTPLEAVYQETRGAHDYEFGCIGIEVTYLSSRQGFLPVKQIVRSLL